MTSSSRYCARLRLRSLRCGRAGSSMHTGYRTGQRSFLRCQNLRQLLIRPVINHEASSYPLYFLCEVEPLGSRVSSRRSERKCPAKTTATLGVNQQRRELTFLSRPHDRFSNLSLYIVGATGGWRGGRRVSMPGLPRLVSSAVDVRAAGQSGIPAAAPVGSYEARSHDRALPAVRADVDHPFAQVGGAVRSAARPALSASSATQEARAC